MTQRRRAQAESSAPSAEAERAIGNLRSAVATCGEAWIESQAELLNHVNELAKGWVQRRREALDATRRSTEEMRDCRDIADILRVQQDWMSGSFQRLVADFEAFTRITANHSQKALMRFAETTKMVGHDLRSAEQATRSTAGAKPEHHRTASE